MRHARRRAPRDVAAERLARWEEHRLSLVSAGHTQRADYVALRIDALRGRLAHAVVVAR